MNSETVKEEKGQKLLSAAGILVCLILLPVLIINCTLLVKSFAVKDEVPDFWGYMPMIVLSDSMVPEIESGDMIICKTEDASEIQVGDIISFYDPDGNGTSVVTHRVVEITQGDEGLSFKTRGDANNVEDRKLVPESAVVGVYTGKDLSGLGNAAMFMQTSKGLMICVVAPLLLFAAIDMVRRAAGEKRQRKDTEALMAELEMLRAQKKEA